QPQHLVGLLPPVLQPPDRGECRLLRWTCPYHWRRHRLHRLGGAHGAVSSAGDEPQRYLADWLRACERTRQELHLRRTAPRRLSQQGWQALTWTCPDHTVARYALRLAKGVFFAPTRPWCILAGRRFCVF